MKLKHLNYVIVDTCRRNPFEKKYLYVKIQQILTGTGSELTKIPSGHGLIFLSTFQNGQKITIR